MGIDPRPPSASQGSICYSSCPPASDCACAGPGSHGNRLAPDGDGEASGDGVRPAKRSRAAKVKQPKVWLRIDACDLVCICQAKFSKIPDLMAMATPTLRLSVCGSVLLCCLAWLRQCNSGGLLEGLRSRGQRVRASQPVYNLWLLAMAMLLGATLRHRVAPVTV